MEGNLKAAVVGRLVVVRGPRGRSSPMARRGPPLAVRSHTADLPVADLFKWQLANAKFCSVETVHIPGYNCTTKLDSRHLQVNPVLQYRKKIPVQIVVQWLVPGYELLAGSKTRFLRKT